MTVVAKFFVSEIVHHEGKPTADKISLGAVCRGAQNAKWSSSTPGGQITLHVLNDAATAYFATGEEYEVHFTHVPKPAPGDGHQPEPEYPGWIKDRSAPPTQCGICGTYGTAGDDGSIDWSVHHSIYDVPAS